MKKKALRSPKLQRKKQQKRKNAILLASILSCLTVALLVYVLLRPELRIHTIEIDGGETVSHELLASAVEQGMEGNYLWFIPKKHILFYPHSALHASLLEAFPSLSHITFSRRGLSSIRVLAVSRTPYVVWCEHEQCFYMDETGFVYSPVPDGAYSFYYRFVNEKTATMSPLGQNRIEREQLSELFSIPVRLEGLGLETDEFRVKQNGEFVVVLAGGTKLFLAGEGFDSALSRLETLLADQGLVHRGKDGLLAVDYIDLRYGNKIYYK